MMETKRGFTLLEVIISMTILATVMMICYQILGDTLEVSERIDRTTRPDKIGKAVLALFRRDLQGTIWYNMGDEIFLGEDLGQEDSSHDQLHFFTSTKPVNSAVNQEEGIFCGGVTSVSYLLESSRNVEGAYTLFRRECAEITEEPFVEGVYFEVYDKIAYLDISYFDGYEWIPSWDSSLKKQEYEEELEFAVQAIIDNSGRVQSGTMSTVSDKQRSGNSSSSGNSGRSTRSAGSTRAGSETDGDVYTGEEGVDRLPVPERGVPQAVRIEIGIMVGSEGGLYKENFTREAPVRVYHYSAVVHIPASRSVRISPDIADSLRSGVEDLAALDGKNVQGGRLGSREARIRTGRDVSNYSAGGGSMRRAGGGSGSAKPTRAPEVEKRRRK